MDLAPTSTGELLGHDNLGSGHFDGGGGREPPGTRVTTSSYALRLETAPGRKLAAPPAYLTHRSPSGLAPASEWSSRTAQLAECAIWLGPDRCETQLRVDYDGPLRTNENRVEAELGHLGKLLG
jgi:hypothetical protein